MAQCITCKYILMRGEDAGKGRCHKAEKGAGPLLDVLAERDCRRHKWACMAQVHSRSKRRFMFNEAGIAKLVSSHE